MAGNDDVGVSKSESTAPSQMYGHDTVKATVKPGSSPLSVQAWCFLFLSNRLLIQS